MSFFNVGQLINFTIPWLALTSALNVIITGLISYRILRLRRRTLAALRNVEADNLAGGMLAVDQGREMDVYTNVVAMLVESALPLSILGIVTCVLVGIDNFVSTTLLCVWGTVAVSIPSAFWLP